MPNDDDIQRHREHCWAEFLRAAEAAAQQNFTLARDLVSRHPCVRGELLAFYKAIQEGRLIRQDDGSYRAIKVRRNVRPATEGVRGYGLDSGIPSDSYPNVPL